ncbi:cell division protein ZapA [Pontibacter sp. BT310]|jgi:cell division protein ZapA|uniref:Cell division protein ZapA n=1 Tax=Pontibacter populi TaxID=890055 RepID=A0ABS6XEF6_9BACT|nr:MULTISPECIES: cell division protein ZapA [Pontibacter]MBJ6119412.1 cell division protein ZapA [Pontibacter sp. BT310]MBR0571840.1 cell division protein ZapA [Microvirga sp. STS03]MBW3366266.1 cell division protein ZapA [Pontibacter populi]
MSELSIKIRIAEREYPMRVKEEEEERLRIVGKLLNERLKFFKDQFGIQDKQDLLAMVAFETMVEKLKLEDEKNKHLSKVGQQLNVLDDLLSSAK